MGVVFNFFVGYDFYMILKNISIVLTLFISIQSWAQDGKFSLFLKNFKSPEVTSGRDIYVYLPPGYSQNLSLSYPVLYMHDGQNLYDPKRAFMGQTWNAQNTLNDLIKSKKIKPIIVVGIDNTSDRINEYTQDIDASVKKGGEALKYLKFIAEDLKTQVDQSYRTLNGREATSIMGSSLGGLISLYAGITYPQVFGSVGALSPSIWWNNKSIIKLFDKSLDLPLKIYIDSGTVGGENPKDVTLFKDNIIARYSDPKNINVVIQNGASHGERFWAQRLPGALRFLFSP